MDGWMNGWMEGGREEREREEGGREGRWEVVVILTNVLGELCGCFLVEEREGRDGLSRHLLSLARSQGSCPRYLGSENLSNQQTPTCCGQEKRQWGCHIRCTLLRYYWYTIMYTTCTLL